MSTPASLNSLEQFTAKEMEKIFNLTMEAGINDLVRNIDVITLNEKSLLVDLIAQNAGIKLTAGTTPEERKRELGQKFDREFIIEHLKKVLEAELCSDSLNLKDIVKYMHQGALLFTGRAGAIKYLVEKQVFTPFSTIYMPDATEFSSKIDISKQVDDSIKITESSKLRCMTTLKLDKDCGVEGAPTLITNDTDAELMEILGETSISKQQEILSKFDIKSKSRLIDEIFGDAQTATIAATETTAIDEQIVAIPEPIATTETTAIDEQTVAIPAPIATTETTNAGENNNKFMNFIKFLVDCVTSIGRGISSLIKARETQAKFKVASTQVRTTTGATPQAKDTVANAAEGVEDVEYLGEISAYTKRP